MTHDKFRRQNMAWNTVV